MIIKNINLTFRTFIYYEVNKIKPHVLDKETDYKLKLQFPNIFASWNPIDPW